MTAFRSAVVLAMVGISKGVLAAPASPDSSATAPISPAAGQQTPAPQGTSTSDAPVPPAPVPPAYVPPAYVAPPPYAYPPPAYGPAAYRDPNAEPVMRWYGWQTLTVDGATLVLTLVTAGVDSSGSTAGVVFLAGYGLGGPTVHWAHENVGTGFASLGLRVGLPLGGALLGAAVADCGSGGGEFCGWGEAAVGLLLGMGAAIAVDSAVLAREPVEAESATVGLRSVRISPFIAANGSRAALIATGAF